MLKRNMILAGVVAAMITAGGCAMQCPVERIQSSAPDQEDSYVPVADPAMQLRKWERATASYANGNVTAGPTGFMYQSAADLPAYVYPVLEAPLFIGQAVASPVVLIVTPPWTPVTYTGATMNPTYTAMPPVGRPAMAVETSAAPTTQP